MAIPDPPKAGSPFCALWTGGWNPKTPKINNFFIPEITLRGGYANRSPIYPRPPLYPTGIRHARRPPSGKIAGVNPALGSREPRAIGAGAGDEL